jgi:23S rRNA (uracil1939-C5)-methyltransferase
MDHYEIIRLGHQGDGIAAGPVFASLTLPGEIVTGQIDGDQLTDIKIVTPSDQRIAPVCRHFKSCGGCQLMHASDDFVAQWKSDVIRFALKAHHIETEMRPCLTSPTQSRRRATFSARRTKKGAQIGFHARASDTIVEIPDCQLLDPRLMAAIPIIAELAQLGASRKAELSAQTTLSDNGLDIAISGGKPIDGQLRIGLGQLCETRKLARLSWNGEVIAMRLPPTQKFGRAQVIPPQGSFLQATEQGERDLVAQVQEIVGSTAKVVDLFSGCGTFSLPLAQTAEVHAVEGNADMIKELDRGWREAQGLKRVTSQARDLFRRPLLPDELNRFDAVVIDPPRAGAQAQIAEIAQSSVGIIAYVSCNPVSFARDAAQLVQSGYLLEWITPIDQFRWSAHVELVAKFSKI